VTYQRPDLERVFTKQCRRCQAMFETRSRIKKRCDACQAIVEQATKRKNDAKRRRVTSKREKV
jgi:hypothetical protein